MFREKLIECCRSWRQILCRRHQPQPGARQRSVIFPFVTVADGEPPDSLGNAFLGLTRSIAPHINPCQANVVCVSEFCNCIAALLHRRHKFIFGQQVASISRIIRHRTSPFRIHLPLITAVTAAA